MNNEKQNIVPELRFPEFQNNWNIVKLKDVSTYFNGKSFEGNVQAKGNYELITLKSIDTDGNLVHSNRFINDKVPTLAKETLVMILSEQAPGLLGMTAIIPEENKYVLNQRVAEIRPNKKVESYFLSKAINSNQAYFSRLGAGMKVQNISKPNVENYEFGIPIISEQQKIANCLSSLDEVITAETEKLNLLQVHKKGLLQQLFPAEGENQPQYRFPEFENDGEWEEEKLGNVTHTTIGEFVIRTRQRPDSPYPVYNGGRSYTGFYDEYNNEANKIIVSARGANAGFVNLIKQRYWAGNSCYSIGINNSDELDLDFLFYYMKENQKRFTDNQQAANIPSVSKGDVVGFTITFPENPLEQQKIANCISSADELIESQTQKIKALKKHKKGLMQKLFPNVNELAV